MQRTEPAPSAASSSTLSLRVLGVAGGAGHVYQGLCSSSFLLLYKQQPWCLVDLGFGVTYTLHQQGYELPPHIIITHNHSDHAGELPVVLRVEQARGRKLDIIAAAPVSERLQTHRMAEHRQLLDIAQLAQWSAPKPETLHPLDANFALRFHASKHSECCYGFVLYQRQPDALTPILGYSGDSGFCQPLYQQLSVCRHAIFDARASGSAWHASFDEVRPYLGERRYIIGHGMDSGSTQKQQGLLLPGQEIQLME